MPNSHDTSPLAIIAGTLPCAASATAMKPPRPSASPAPAKIAAYISTTTSSKTPKIANR